jgi:hypothetical protein
MRKMERRSEFTTLEYLSLTLTQVNQDAYGKQTSNRTYWSTRKKICKPDENAGSLILKNSQEAENANSRDSHNKEKTVEKIKQLSLFPIP